MNTKTLLNLPEKYPLRWARRIYSTWYKDHARAADYLLVSLNLRKDLPIQLLSRYTAGWYQFKKACLFIESSKSLPERGDILLFLKENKYDHKRRTHKIAREHDQQSTGGFPPRTTIYSIKHRRGIRSKCNDNSTGRIPFQERRGGRKYSWKDHTWL